MIIFDHFVTVVAKVKTPSALFEKLNWTYLKSMS